jgi:parvulin-like peptidyl-prolyl isomerase
MMKKRLQHVGKRLRTGEGKTGKFKAAVKKRLSRRRNGEEVTAEALSNLPRITNETVAEHREEVLSSARKYIYPLQHSKNRIIKISTTLFGVAVIVFFVYCGLALYKLQSTSTFLYEVTRVLPFPVAKAGSDYVAYENYLFELRHLIHYYEVQQKEDLDGKDKAHLEALRRESLQKVIDDAYVKQLAKKNNISVSNREVNDQITLVKSQNRLGTNDQMLADVLKEFWGWSVSDFRRELKSQLLAQKVASHLDVATHARASNALAALQQGKDFAALAAEASDDQATKANGGQYGAPIAKSNRDVPPQVVDALFKLQPGQTSEVINTGYTLEIVKVISVEGDKVQGAHVSFNLTPIEKYIEPLKKENKERKFISV